MSHARIKPITTVDTQQQVTANRHLAEDTTSQGGKHLLRLKILVQVSIEDIWVRTRFSSPAHITLEPRIVAGPAMSLSRHLALRKKHARMGGVAHVMIQVWIERIWV